MGDPTQRAAHIKDTADLIADIENNTLPAVSFGKPDGLLDGHPQSSKIDLFEAYVQNILDALEANPRLKAETAVFITWDEAGGYWDSGFVQPIDFFGDGPRIPLLVLSPYSTGGKVNHSYADHVSLLKFIERNWHLRPLTDRSRDNLPNPKIKTKQSLRSDQHAGARRSVRRVRLRLGAGSTSPTSNSNVGGRANQCPGLGDSPRNPTPPMPAPMRPLRAIGAGFASASPILDFVL